MKALKVNTSDSTCFDAALSAGHFSKGGVLGYVAVPDCYAHACYVTRIARKHSPDYVSLDFPNGDTKSISDYFGETAEEAIEEAKECFEDEGKEENDIEWWETID